LTTRAHAEMHLHHAVDHTLARLQGQVSHLRVGRREAMIQYIQTRGLTDRSPCAVGNSASLGVLMAETLAHYVRTPLLMGRPFRVRTSQRLFGSTRPREEAEIQSADELGGDSEEKGHKVGTQKVFAACMESSMMSHHAPAPA